MFYNVNLSNLENVLHRTNRTRESIFRATEGTYFQNLPHWCQPWRHHWVRCMYQFAQKESGYDAQAKILEECALKQNPQRKSQSFFCKITAKIIYNKDFFLLPTLIIYFLKILLIAFFHKNI